VSAIRSPLLVTSCEWCKRRRSCAYLFGWKYPLCHQCLRRLMPHITKALRAFNEQDR
jgi:hypothetical protein